MVQLAGRRTRSRLVRPAKGVKEGEKEALVWVPGPTSGERMDRGGDFVILAGDGAYEGLYAALSLPWSDVHGVIFEGAPPAGPIPPSAD